MKSKLSFVILCILMTAYCGRGFYYLAFERDGGDLYNIWATGKRFINAENPYQTHSERGIQSHLALSRDWTQDKDLPLSKTHIARIGFPPWAFPFILAFTWPNAIVEPYYFALLNLLSLFLIFRWLNKHLKRQGYPPSAAIAGMATSTFFMALRLGQISILILGLLILAFEAEEKERDFLAALYFSFALLKPNISLPFALLFLVKRKWKILLLTAFFILISLLITVIHLQTNPLILFQEMHQGIHDILRSDAGWVHWGLGFPTDILDIFMAFGSICILSLGLYFCYRLKHLNLYTQIVFIALISRLWTYHGIYDNMMQIFLLAGLADQVATKEENWIWFILVGVILWLPPTAFLYTDAVNLAIALIWIFATAAYIRKTKDYRISMPATQLR